MTEAIEVAATTSDLTADRWRDRALAGFVSQSEGFLSLVDDLDDDRASAAVPGSAWTAAQTIAHVCSLYRRLTDDTRRAADPAGVAEQNAADVAAIGTDLRAIAEEIRERLAAVRAFAPHIEVDREFPFHAGQRVTMTAGLGVLIGELIAHGDDVARAAGATWTPPGDGIEILWRFTLPVLTGWTTERAASVDRRWAFDAGWPDGPVVLRVDHGTVSVEPATPVTGDTADRHVVVSDPVGLTLAFPYRRRTIDDPAVAELAALFQPI